MGFIKRRGDYFPIAGYEVAQKYGFQGTQEEWIRMLMSSRSSDHGNLKGRTAPNQHPKSAITGLTEDINDIYGRIEALEVGGEWNTVELLPITAGRGPTEITVTSETRQVNKNLPFEITLADGKIWETEVICWGLHFANATELQEAVNIAGVYISDGTLQDNNYIAADLYNTYSGSIYNGANSARLLRSRGVISKDGSYGGMYLEEIGYINNEFSNQKYIFKTNNNKRLTKVSLFYTQPSMSIETFGLIFRYRRIL